MKRRRLSLDARRKIGAVAVEDGQERKRKEGRKGYRFIFVLEGAEETLSRGHLRPSERRSLFAGISGFEKLQVRRTDLTSSTETPASAYGFSVEQ